MIRDRKSGLLPKRFLSILSTVPVTPFPISMTVTKESPVLECLGVDRLNGGWHGSAHNRPASVSYSGNGWVVEPLIFASAKIAKSQSVKTEFPDLRL